MAAQRKSPLDDRRPNLTGVMRDDMLADPPPPRPAPQPPLRCLADLPEQPQEWLWPGRIPCGSLTLLCGDEGRGKSLVTLDVAARVSAGLPWPHDGAPSPPADVLIFAAEDSLGRTIRSRLFAAGADLNRIHYIATTHWSHEPSSPAAACRLSASLDTPFGAITHSPFASLQRDVRHLKAALEALPDCRLVVIDPFPAYLDVDLYFDQPEEVRCNLAPLTALADRSNAAVLAVVQREQYARLQSGRKRSGLRTLASMSRAAYLIDRATDGPYRHVLLPVKNNLGDAATAAPFNVREAPNGAALIDWSPEPLLLSRDRVVAIPNNDEPRRGAEIERAVAWLAHQLADGPVPSQDLLAHAIAIGISERCLSRARAKLGVQATHDRAIGGRWLCCLPSKNPENRRDCQQNQLADSADSAVLAASQIPEVFPPTPPATPSTIP